MASSRLQTMIRASVLFLIPRYSFVNALTFLMLLGERARNETHPPMDPRTIYVHMGVFIVCGVCMGFNLRRKDAALVHVGQLLYLAFSLYTNQRLGYTPWLRTRMATRSLGVSGVFLLYAYFTAPKRLKSKQLMRGGEVLLGIYLLAWLYTLMESKEDKQAFLYHIPGGVTALYVYAVLLAACGLCFLPGAFVHDVCQALIVMMLVTTTLIDCDIKYWTDRRGIDFWNQIRLAVDSVCITLGISMYLTCTEKQVYTTED